jgi:Domain of unknown function (DUF4389)
MTDTGERGGEQQAPPPLPVAGMGAGAGGGDLTALASDPGYPVTAGLNSGSQIARWRVIGNYIMAIPHFIVLYVLQIVAQICMLIAWFAILFTGRIPGGLADFIAGVQRYGWRVFSFAFFLREPYPSFSLPTGYADPGDDPAWLQISPAERYSRLAVFFRFILIIPQALFGIVLGIALWVCLVIAWFAVLITGRWPEGLRSFVVRVVFWSIRVNAWYSLLADPYPPFTVG